MFVVQDTYKSTKHVNLAVMVVKLVPLQSVLVSVVYQTHKELRLPTQAPPTATV